MSQEIVIDGIGIAPEVMQAIVSRAVEEIDGVASVGMRDFATNLVSMFSARGTQSGPAVEATVEDGKLCLAVHVTVFFGYPFKKLAESIRSTVAAAITAQVGVNAARIDVCIDGLVFPKE